MGIECGTVTEKNIVAPVSLTLGFEASWVMEIEVIEPELIPVIFTLLATPFAVPPESAKVILAPPVDGQLDKEEVGYTKLSILTTI